MNKIKNYLLIKFFKENNLVLPGVVRVMRYKDHLSFPFWHELECTEAPFDYEDPCEDDACESLTKGHAVEDHCLFEEIAADLIKSNPEKFCEDCFENLIITAEELTFPETVGDLNVYLEGVIEVTEIFTKEKFDAKTFLKQLDKKYETATDWNHVAIFKEAKRVLQSSLPAVKNLTPDQFQAVKEEEVSAAKVMYDEWSKSVVKRLNSYGFTEGAAVVKEESQIKPSLTDMILFKHDKESSLRHFTEEAYSVSEGYVLMPEDLLMYSQYGPYRPEEASYVKISEPDNKKLVETTIKLNQESKPGSAHFDIREAYRAAKMLL